MGGIFNNRNAILRCQRGNRLHITEISSNVNRNNRFDRLIVLEFLFYFFRIDTIRIRSDISVNYFAAEVQRARCRRNKGIGARQYLRPLPDSERIHGQHQTV